MTYRYKQAEAEGLLEVVSSRVGKGRGVHITTVDDSDSTESTRMKASVVTEITRVISASLTSTAKPDTTGLERRVRWRGLGIVAEGDATASTPTIVQDNMSTGRSIYTALEAKLPYSLINVGIHFHPLRHDSWVLVGFQDRVWLGNGVCMFVCKIFDIAYPK